MTTAITMTLVITGYMTRYDPGVMQQVTETRIELGHVPPQTDPRQCVALVECAWLGRPVALDWPDGLRTYHTACDCSHDPARHRAEGLAVEVPYAVALERKLPIGPYHLPMDGPLDGVRVLIWPDRPQGRYVPE